jgi:tRNA A37 threonylcarbamoyladenosine modification protein TsaB
MLLLIDTRCNSGFAVAVGKEKIESYKIVKKDFVQSELLLKEIDNLMRRAGVKKLKIIFVSAGPGDFSALRVGCATANALGFAWRIPVIGVKPDKTSSGGRTELEKLWQAGLKKVRVKNFNRKKQELVFPSYHKEPNIGI